jgi:NitT/TauT family transport system substrate-binding protein
MYRFISALLGLTLAVLAATPARSETTNVRFILDFLLQGQQSPFVLGREKGFYKAAGVDFAAFDPGRGGADAITKVASGAYDIGFGDLSALIEFDARNPGRGMIAVCVIYDQAPLAVISLKKAGITKPTDLAGRRGAAPVTDASYRLFEAFARVNGFDPQKVKWAHVQPQVREPMIVRGDADFETGFVMSVLPVLANLGVSRDQVNVMMFRDWGLDLYSNVVFTTPAFAKAHPAAVRGFVKATIEAWQAAAADPAASIAALKHADPLVDPAVEIGRLNSALAFIATPAAQKNGMGDVDPARLQKHIDIVTDGYHLPRKVPPDMVFDASFLPPAAERRIAK